MNSYGLNPEADNMDGCCLNVTSEEAISDIELPKAIGGITNTSHAVRSNTSNVDDVCFCDVGISNDEATMDDDLPKAVGGVE